MKLGGYNHKAEQRVNAFFVKLFNPRSLMMLMALAALVMAAGANQKLTP